MAQFLLIVALALGSNSAFAEEVSDMGPSSQNMSEAEESISEELKFIYQEEVDQILSEGISYSEEERLSDFPDLDFLLADDGVPTRVAKVSADQKVEKGKGPNSELGIQNRKSTSEIFSVSSDLSKNCLLGLSVLLPNLKVGYGVGQEFLPRAQIQERTRSQEAASVGGDPYADSLSLCANVFSLYLGGEGSAAEPVCSAENQQNSLLGPGVPTMSGWVLGKTTENALGSGLGSEFDQIQGIVLVSEKFSQNRTFSYANLSQWVEGGQSPPVRAAGQKVAGEFSAERSESRTLNQELKSSLEKVLSKAGQDSYKFSSGRPTPEILT
ncbi:hypothetical protein [Leptospira dzoumogneensis]|uniref:hypothetical protein n=1 Tax=Leptospira dzoumogneensis TaxID=2484904 RepID=UPI001FCCBB42|nr:hypothetical protein [Leptospira dzoumogneensis]